MKPFTLRQAAEATGIDKMRISRAIKNGDLSATKKGNVFQIEPSELFRVFPKSEAKTSNEDKPRQSETGAQDRELIALRHRIEMLETQKDSLETERRRERDTLSETIEDLRSRLDKESSERQRLTLLLTDQRKRKEPEPKKGFWQWFTRGNQSDSSAEW
ncbi:MAG: hypothetical protein AAFQ29_06245 [Pseudomonadota bacterium]